MIRESIAGLALLAALSGCNGGEEGGTEIGGTEQQESGTEDPVLDVAPGVVGSGGGRGAGMDSALTGRPDSTSAATIGTAGGGGAAAAGNTPPPASGGH